MKYYSLVIEKDNTWKMVNFKTRELHSGNDFISLENFLKSLNEKTFIFMLDLEKKDGYKLINLLIENGYQNKHKQRVKYFNTTIDNNKNIIKLSIKLVQRSKQIEFFSAGKYIQINEAKHKTKIILKILEAINLIIPLERIGITPAHTGYKYMVDSLPPTMKKQMLFFVDDKMLDEGLRKWLRPALVSVNPNYQNKIVKNVYRYDANSAYLAFLRNERIPWGKPRSYSNTFEKEDNFYMLYKVYFNKPLYAKKNKFPFIDTKDIKTNSISKPQTIFPHKINSNESIYLTSDNVDLFKETYEGEYVIRCKFFFKTIENPFKEAIDKILEVKKSLKKDPLKELVIKTIINAGCYGGFGANHVKFGNDINMQEEGFKFEQSVSVSNLKRYLPIAIKITTGWKNKYVRDINANIENFISGNTDSLKLSKKAKGIDIDKTKLGAYKPLKRLSEAIYRSGGYYLEIDENGENNLVIKGLPNDCKLDIEKEIKPIDFINGKTFKSSLKRIVIGYGNEINELVGDYTIKPINNDLKELEEKIAIRDEKAILGLTKKRT